MSIPFQSYDVYQSALEWVELSRLLRARSKARVPSSFLESMARSTLAVPLEIASGDYLTARRSALQCIAQAQALHREGAITTNEYQRAYDILIDVVLSLKDVESDPHLDHAALSTARGRPRRHQ